MGGGREFFATKGRTNWKKHRSRKTWCCWAASRGEGQRGTEKEKKRKNEKKGKGDGDRGLCGGGGENDRPALRKEKTQEESRNQTKSFKKKERDLGGAGEDVARRRSLRGFESLKCA